MDLMKRRGMMLSAPHLERAFGSIASFNTNYPYKLEKMIVGIDLVQDLHGYDAPWPAGGGKNLLVNERSNQTVNGLTVTVNDDGTILVNGTATANTFLALGVGSTYNDTFASGSYIVSGCPTGGSTSTYCIRIYKSGGVTFATDVGNGAEFTDAGTSRVAIVIFSGATLTNVLFKPMVRLASETDATFEPYSNICPITGWTERKLHRTGVSLIGGDAFLGNAFTKTDSGYELTYGGSGVSQRGSAYADITGLPAGRYTLEFLNCTYPDGCTVTYRFRSPGGSWTPLTIIGGSAVGRRTFTMPANAAQIQFYFSPNTASVGDKLTADDVVLMREEDSETPEPYKGNVYDITFPAEAGTVYGGTLDVVNKKLTVERVDLHTDLTTASWAFNNNGSFWQLSWSGFPALADLSIKSDIYVNLTPSISNTEDCIIGFVSSGATLRIRDSSLTTLSDVQTKFASSQAIFNLATPIVYNLSDVPEITTLLGTNNIWSSCGNVDVTFYKT